MTKRRTSNTMVKRRRTSNTMAERRTSNTMVKRRRTSDLLLLARFTDSHYLFGIFKLFLSKFREIFTIFRQFSTTAASEYLFGIFRCSLETFFKFIQEICGRVLTLGSISV
jgi:hypothetical protein